MNEEIEHLRTLLGFILIKTGPILLETEELEAGLPEDVLGVMVEKTQEGYLVFLTNEEFEETNDEQTD